MGNLQRLITNGGWLGKRVEEESIWNRRSDARRSLPPLSLIYAQRKIGPGRLPGPRHLEILKPNRNT